jgi:two-component system sensor kinase FixL
MVFVLDIITPGDSAVAVLYVGVVLLSARFLQKRGVVLASLGLMGLTVLSYLLSVHDKSPAIALSTCVLSLAAIGVTTFLAVQGQSMEKVLREQAGLLDLTHDTVFVRDMNDVIIYWNRGAEELYGWTREEAIGRVTHELLHTRFPEPLDAIAARLLNSGRWEGELVHTKRDGALVTVASRWSLQRDETGRTARTLETNNDITDRKRAEDQRERLRQLQDELARVNRITTMGELTASLAHEVNQPIAAAMTDANTCLKWLTRSEPDVQEAREAAKRAVNGASRAAEIISRIRSLFKLSRPEHQWVDINVLIAELVTLVRSEALRNRVSVRTTIAGDLPEVMGDRVQLQQVLLNLMMNSIEAMKEVDGRREIAITSGRDDRDHVIVSVADTGVGLPANVDEIFRPFVTTKPDGTGMGLAISRSIIETHGGRLWAAPTAGRGATFFFNLPAAVATQV